MRPDLSNRIVFLLACCGAAVALITGFFHMFGASLPCGEVAQGQVSGCDQIAGDTWAWVQGVPTAFFGASLYLLAILLTMVREARGVSNTREVGGWLWGLLFAGTVVSVVMLAHATFEIRAMCSWCWASGVIMFLGLVTQTLGLSKKEFGAGKSIPIIGMAIVGGVIVLGGAGWGFITSKEGARLALNIQEVVPNNEIELIRETSASLGPKDAPITIVAFSDLHCPSCARNHEFVKQTIENRLSGQARLIYRHFPLIATHPNSGTAAILAEWAKSKGKFFEFVDLMMKNQDQADHDSMLNLITLLEMDANEAKRVIDDIDFRKPFSEAVHQDRLDAYKLGVNMTPTWYVRYPNGSFLSSTGDGIKELLSDAELRSRGFVRR